ncbi:hypothetical protein BC826DRAFT_1037595 [Russula brevipes]|nr:hypothetical protein BC826DRAFT_1037595 [Russula brevipes]
MHGCIPLDRDLPRVANYSRTGPYPTMVLLPRVDPLPSSLLVTPESGGVPFERDPLTGFPRSAQGPGLIGFLPPGPHPAMVLPLLALPPRSHPSVHSTATATATSLRMSRDVQEPGFVKWSSPSPIQRWYYSIRWRRHRLRVRMRAAPTPAPLRFCLPISPV